MPKYYHLALPRTLKKVIEDLFENDEIVRRLYDNNKVKFIEDATRRHILAFRGEVELSVFRLDKRKEERMTPD